MAQRYAAPDRDSSRAPLEYKAMQIALFLHSLAFRPLGAPWTPQQQPMCRFHLRGTHACTGQGNSKGKVTICWAHHTGTR